jgi:polyhydroxyalkanoate synthesis regulator phasin
MIHIADEEGLPVNKAWQRYMEMATGLGQTTQKKAESVVRSLVKQGEVATDRAEKTVDDLLQRSERNRKVISQLVKSETERTVQRLGLARNRDVERLQNKVERLEKQVKGTSGSSSQTKKSSAKKSSSQKRSSKKRSARKSGAKKSSAKKNSSSKSSTKKAGAKSAPRKDAQATAANVTAAQAKKVTPPASSPGQASPSSSSSGGNSSSGNSSSGGSS